MKNFLIAFAAIVLIGVSAPAHAKNSAAEIKELKALVQKLAARVDELEKQQVTTDAKVTANAGAIAKEADAKAAALGGIEPAAGGHSNNSYNDHAGEHLYQSTRHSFNWEGPYLGAFLALNKGQSQDKLGFSVQDNVDGVSGGLELGYNYVMKNNNVLLGGEVEAALADIGGDTSVFPLPHTLNINSTFAVRGRVGRLFGDNLLFVQGGMAFANIKDRIVPGGPDLISTWLKGWQGGFGYERAINEVFSWRGDYLYTAYDKENSSIVPTYSGDLHNHALRLGVSMKF